jgi:hypothetical protein
MHRLHGSHPSPTAATRLTKPLRTLPTANITGRLVSRPCGARDNGHCDGKIAAPVRTKRLLSSATHCCSQSVFSSAPRNMNRCLIGIVVAIASRDSTVTRTMRSRPLRAVTRVCVCISISGSLQFAGPGNAKCCRHDLDLRLRHVHEAPNVKGILRLARPSPHHRPRSPTRPRITSLRHTLRCSTRQILRTGLSHATQAYDTVHPLK